MSLFPLWSNRLHWSWAKRVSTNTVFITCDEFHGGGVLRFEWPLTETSLSLWVCFWVTLLSVVRGHTCIPLSSHHISRGGKKAVLTLVLSWWTNCEQEVAKGMFSWPGIVCIWIYFDSLYHLWSVVPFQWLDWLICCHRDYRCPVECGIPPRSVLLHTSN